MTQTIARAPGRGVTVMVATTLVTRIDPSAVHVVAVTGGKETAKLLRQGEEVVVGVGEDAGLRIDDETVSRMHATFKLEALGVRVVDMKSTNGTFYSGAQIREATLPIGSVLTLGNATVHLRPHESELRGGRAVNPVGQLGGLVGEDSRMKEMFALLKDVAAVDATVIIEGETGTGKELVAQALHDASPRAQRPFVVFDCTSIPKDLVESILFGHVKGAFTGATDKRVGAFRRAHGGTIFLDEIGELPLELQPKLLRVLESRTVQAVGADEPEKIDVRVVCATHRDLKAEVRAGRFREDLYYRLAVVKVQLPPLRERPDDIEVLAKHFARQFGSEGVRLDGIDALRKHEFPGNARELRNIVERALSLVRGDRAVDLSKFIQTTSEDEPTHPSGNIVVPAEAKERIDGVRAAVEEALASQKPFKDSKALVVDAFERAFLEHLMKGAGSLSKAAQTAQMDRKHLRDLLKRHGMRGDGVDE
jgi:DNA-binding NtrC family response regulator